MAFDCHESAEFAIRPFLGGVNGISGKNLLEVAQSDKTATPRKQDYITVPEQKRLDGVSISPGVVKQLVATRMTSVENPQRRVSFLSKFGAESSNVDAKDIAELPSEEVQTIESQMTGKDEIGGIQLQIIPQFKLKHMFAGSMKDACPAQHGGPLESYQPVPASVVKYDVLKTPEELGLHEGDVIHIRSLKNERGSWGWREKLVRDLLAEVPGALSLVDLVELEVFRPSSLEKILTILNPSSDEDGVSFKVRASNPLLCRSSVQ